MAATRPASDSPASTWNKPIGCQYRSHSVTIATQVTMAMLSTMDMPMSDHFATGAQLATTARPGTKNAKQNAAKVRRLPVWSANMNISTTTVAMTHSVSMMSARHGADGPEKTSVAAASILACGSWASMGRIV
jgi:hypothetical protein